MAMESKIAGLRETYTEQHPDVQAWRAQLNVVKKRKETLEQQEAQKKPEPAPKEAPRQVVRTEVVREGRELEGAIKKLQSAIEAKDIELDDARKEAQRVDSQVQFRRQNVTVELYPGRP
jgi:hypothetical protein